jgi:hypothetical protein
MDRSSHRSVLVGVVGVLAAVLLAGGVVPSSAFAESSAERTPTVPADVGTGAPGLPGDPVSYKMSTTMTFEFGPDVLINVQPTGAFCAEGAGGQIRTVDSKPVTTRFSFDVYNYTHAIECLAPSDFAYVISAEGRWSGHAVVVYEQVPTPSLIPNWLVRCVVAVNMSCEVGGSLTARTAHFAGGPPVPPPPPQPGTPPSMECKDPGIPTRGADLSGWVLCHLSGDPFPEVSVVEGSLPPGVGFEVVRDHETRGRVLLKDAVMSVAGDHRYTLEARNGASPAARHQGEISIDQDVLELFAVDARGSLVAGQPITFVPLLVGWGLLDPTAPVIYEVDGKTYRAPIRWRDPGKPGSLTIPGLPQGTYEVVARFEGDDGYRTNGTPRRASFSVGPAPQGPSPFGDVGVDHPFHDPITWLAEAGIVDGYPDGSFRPSGTTTRAAAVALLHRQAGAPDVGQPSTPTFTDVGVDHPFATAIAWAHEQGFVDGYPDGTFRPGAPLSRQAGLALLHRAAGSPPVDLPATPLFRDVPLDHPFIEAIAWADEHGIAHGYPDDTFGPDNPLSRQAFAVILYRHAAAG